MKFSRMSDRSFRFSDRPDEKCAHSGRMGTRRRGKEVNFVVPLYRARVTDAYGWIAKNSSAAAGRTTAR